MFTLFVFVCRSLKAGCCSFDAQEEDDAVYAGAMVQALNLILLTSCQLAELRALLAGALRSPEAAEVFAALFASWSRSCAASLALALLAQAHGLACELLAVMAQEPLSMRPETTVELSQLVSLLEAPAFAPLRLQLLQPGQHPALLRAVHGLLMLLPQVRTLRALCVWMPLCPDPAAETYRTAPLLCLCCVCAGRCLPSAASPPAERCRHGNAGGGGGSQGTPAAAAARVPCNRWQRRRQRWRQRRQPRRGGSGCCCCCCHAGPAGRRPVHLAQRVQAATGVAAAGAAGAAAADRGAPAGAAVQVAGGAVELKQRGGWYCHGIHVAFKLYPFVSSES